jgi:hypothetical protein
MEVQLHAFLTSALGEGEWLASRPGHFTPTERASAIHRTGGLVSVRGGLDAVEKIPCLCRESNPYT